VAIRGFRPVFGPSGRAILWKNAAVHGDQHHPTWQSARDRGRASHRDGAASATRREKAEIAKRDIYDVWLPDFAPSENLLKEFFPIIDDKAWKTFKRRFLAEMKAPAPKHDLDLLTALSHQTNLAVGCYRKEEARCHRSLLRELLLERGASVADE